MISGRCLCEAVGFEAEPSHRYGPDRAMGVCRCASCQRWTGSPSLPFVVVLPERFRVTHGQELLVHYRDEDATMRAFCRRCGTGLYQDLGTSYYVSAGVVVDLTLEPGFELTEPAARPER